MVTHEAFIIWRNNKTVKWLNKLLTSEKDKLIADAMKSARGWIIDKHKERKDFVHKRKKEKLKEKQEKKEQEKKKEEARTSDLVHAANNLVQYYGVWTSVNRMNQMLSVTVDKQAAIMLQVISQAGRIQSTYTVLFSK